MANWKEKLKPRRSSLNDFLLKLFGFFPLIFPLQPDDTYVLRKRRLSGKKLPQDLTLSLRVPPLSHYAVVIPKGTPLISGGVCYHTMHFGTLLNLGIAWPGLDSSVHLHCYRVGTWLCWGTWNSDFLSLSPQPPLSYCMNSILYHSVPSTGFLLKCSPVLKMEVMLWSRDSEVKCTQ